MYIQGGAKDTLHSIFNMESLMLSHSAASLYSLTSYRERKDECELLSWSEKVPKVKYVKNITITWNCIFIVTKILLLPVDKFFTSTHL
jgi:hypothetical protein